ncbi:MAG: class I SAM-dependent methyltransferase [Anaerolineae bacterium]|nr:class I SAM-dependent methyltransferase [Anaerolineae bacterium]
MVEAMRIEKARLYEQYRLPYAPEMVADLLRQIGPARVVADIGAGTGQLARRFAETSDTVYAVEPDSAMRMVAAEALKNYPNIHLVDAYAEQIPLPESSIDLLVIGNAFHRFKADALQELRRILKHTGWAAVISYTFTDTAFSEMLFPKLASLEGFAARTAKAWHRTPVADLFGDRPTQTLRYPQSVTEDWEAFWGSARSGIEAPGPDDPDFASFERINREVFATFSVEGQLRVDYETRVVFGQPKS